MVSLQNGNTSGVVRVFAARGELKMSLFSVAIMQFILHRPKY